MSRRTDARTALPDPVTHAMLPSSLSVKKDQVKTYRPARFPLVWFSLVSYAFALTSMSLRERPILYDIRAAPKTSL